MSNIFDSTHEKLYISRLHMSQEYKKISKPGSHIAIPKLITIMWL